jgi:hypothetical protein
MENNRIDNIILVLIGTFLISDTVCGTLDLNILGKIYNLTYVVPLT